MKRTPESFRVKVRQLFGVGLIGAAVATAAAVSAQPLPGGWCGGQLSALSPERARVLGVAGGAVLDGFNPGSPCRAAGLKPTDVVVRIGEVEILSPDDMRAALTARQPGDRVVVRYRDLAIGGAEAAVEVTLGVRPAPEAPAR